MLNVLHLRSSPFLGSPEKLILGRFRHMPKGQCQYHVGVFDEQQGVDNEFLRHLRGLGCDAIKLNSSIVAFLRSMKDLRTYIADHKINVICAHDYKSNLYAVVLKLITGRNIMTVHHGRTRTSRRISWYYRIDNLCMRYFDLIVCVSRATAERVSGLKVRPGTVVVIPNAVDCDEIVTLSDEPDDVQWKIDERPEKKILYAGRLSFEKGVAYLLKAAKAILNQHSDCLFLILGEGPERQSLANWVRNEGLQDKILLGGFKRNIMNVLKHSQFLVLPSLAEGMPVVILEAFALGKPVIASRVGGVPEIVKENRTGLLIEPGDVGQLTDAINALLEDQHLVNTMGETAQTYVRQCHNFTLMSERYLAAYGRVAANQDRCVQ